MVSHHLCFYTELPNFSLGPHRLSTRDPRQNNHHQSSLSGYVINSNKYHPTLPPMTQGPIIQSQRSLKGRSNVSEGSSLEPTGSDANSTSKQRHGLIPTVAASGDVRLDSSESDITPRRRKPRSKRTRSIMVEDSSDGQTGALVLDMTRTRVVFLQDLLNRLLRENKDSRPFVWPVDAVAENIPDYHIVITRAMDLHTLKDNLHKGVYSTVEGFEADFNLMIENSIRFNGPRHEVSQAGLRLLKVFKFLMASLPCREQRLRNIRDLRDMVR